MSKEKAQNRAPSAERQRKLQQVAFSPSAVLSRDLPRDTVLRGISFRLSGNIVTTFASGTPVADSAGGFDNLVPRIDIVINGSRTVKSVRPIFLAMQQLFYSKILGERKSSAGATAAVQSLPTVDAGWTYGTTGQITSYAETIWMPFEMIWCDQGAGREATWLNLKGVASAEIRFTTAAYAALLGFANTAPVVWSLNNLVIDITLQEQADVPPQLQFSDWKQTTKQILFSGQSTDYPIDINRGNSLSGLWFYAQDGAAGSTTTATGKLPSNMLIQKITLVQNGQTSLKQTTFQELQAENRARQGFSAPYASNVSRVDGVAFLNLLARMDITTALDCRPPNVDSVQLVVNTSNSTDVSFTNSPSLTIMTDEIVLPR